MSEDMYDFDDEDKDALRDKYLVFTLSDESYCIEINHVIEITGLQKITEVPDSETYLRGIINLRGKILPVVDVRLRFGLEFRPYNERTCIIICNYQNTSVGLIVDSVSEVAIILPENIEPPPVTNKMNKSYFLKGMGKVADDVKMIIELKSLLSESIDNINELSLEA